MTKEEREGNLSLVMLGMTSIWESCEGRGDWTPDRYSAYIAGEGIASRLKASARIS